MILPSTTVLIVADASIYQPTRAASWACVIQRLSPEPGEPIEFCGLLRGEVLSSTSAEMRGISNALLMAREHNLVWPNDRATVVCDNRACIMGLAGEAKIRPIDVQLPFVRAQRLVAELRARFAFLHIHGHTKNEGPVYELNRRADELCGPIALKEHLRRGGRPNQVLAKKLARDPELAASLGVPHLATTTPPAFVAQKTAATSIGAARQ